MLKRWTKVIKEFQMKGKEITKEMLASLAPYRKDHINRFGALLGDDFGSLNRGAKNFCSTTTCSSGG